MNRVTRFLLFAVILCCFDLNAQSQIGEDITFGENNSYEFGGSVSISSDGSRMVTSHLPTNRIGAHEVRVSPDAGFHCGDCFAGSARGNHAAEAQCQAV